MQNFKVSYSVNNKDPHFENIKPGADLGYHMMIDRFFAYEFRADNPDLSFCPGCDLLVWTLNVYADEERLRQRSKEIEAFLPGVKILVKIRDAKDILEVIDGDTEKLRSIARGATSPIDGRPLPYIKPVTK